MDTVFTVGSSFGGLLSAVSAALEAGADSPIFLPEGEISGSLFDPSPIPDDPDRADRLIRDIHQAAGRGAVRDVTALYLSEMPDTADLTYRYCRLLLAVGGPVNRRHTHPVAGEVNRRCRAVGREVHRFAGLLRFMELADGALYAPYAPRYNITLPLARTFRERLAGERWVIHDRTRDLAVLGDAEGLHPVVGIRGDVEKTGLSPDEQALRACWRTYTRTISIPERENPDLQRKFIPLRYRTYLPELAGKGSGGTLQGGD